MNPPIRKKQCCIKICEKKDWNLSEGTYLTLIVDKDNVTGKKLVDVPYGKSKMEYYVGNKLEFMEIFTFQIF